MDSEQQADPLEVCYICAQPFDEDRPKTQEHFPPRSLFPKGQRDHLTTLPAHKTCNQAFAKDDEYFRFCMTAASWSASEPARKVWDGPVLRGFKRDEARGFRSAILDKFLPVERTTEAGIYVGEALVMLQDAKRILRVTDRVARGLVTHRTGNVLPRDWPTQSIMFHNEGGIELCQSFQMRLFRLGDGVFMFDTKHLREDTRESLVLMVFYEQVAFFAVAGPRMNEEFGDWLASARPRDPMPSGLYEP